MSKPDWGALAERSGAQEAPYLAAADPYDEIARLQRKIADLEEQLEDAKFDRENEWNLGYESGRRTRY